VEAGQRGTRIVFWRPVTSTKINADGEQENKTFPLLREYVVFNAEQCEGAGRFCVQSVASNASVDFEPANQVIAATGADVRHVAGDKAAYFRPPLDYIVLPLKDQFDKGPFVLPGYYTTAFHELMHWTEHRLGWTGSYALGELRAEIGAAYLAAEITQIADDRGIMRPTARKTLVSLYEPLPGEVASLYEMGLPIVETGDKWHVSVAQKITLNRDRNNVKPSYLRTTRTLVLNQTHDRLTEADANADWVRQAASDANCSSDAIRSVLDLSFGELRAAFDPSDPEANKNWVARGGTLVYGPMLSSQEWKNAKAANAIQSAGKLCPSSNPYSQDPNAREVCVLPSSKWSDDMKRVAEYAVFLGKELMDVMVTVSFVHANANFAACYGDGELDFNMSRLPRKWLDGGITEALDQLIIHELGHEFAGDHLSRKYYDGLCLLGARLKRLALDKPEAFRRFAQNCSQDSSNN
jgi:hypothetical protein